MDRIARELGLDPLALRRHNLYRDGDMTSTGQILVDTGGFAVLDDALSAVEGPAPPSTGTPGGGSRWARGRGLALVFHGCGFTGNGESWLKAKVGMVLEGDEVHILTASTDLGQGAETTFVQIAAAELGLDASRIIVDPHDTGRVPDSGPTVASRTCQVVGGEVQRCAAKLRGALQAETGLDTADMDRLIAARGDGADLHVQTTYEDDGSLQWDAESYQGDAYPTFGWSCAIVDLDVDMDTGEVRYRRFISSTDVGKAINPLIVEGQVEGGSLQALGYATSEEVVLDALGCMRNDRLTNYIIPTAVDAPEMITRLIEIPYAGGPFGAKGMGEIPMDGPAAAVAQAIEAATGVVLNRLPMTPERVLGAMESP
jgi:CO/xanthine dehydrogenase Mo-binding subunit